jgi:hypothetical protein
LLLGYLGALQGVGLARIGLARAVVRGKDQFVRGEQCVVTVETGAFGYRNLGIDYSLGMTTVVATVAVMAFVGIGTGLAELCMVVLRCYMTAKWVSEMVERRDLGLQTAVIG